MVENQVEKFIYNINEQLDVSRFQSVKCKRETWSTVAEAVIILRGHGYYLKKNEVVDLALRNFISAIKKMRKL